MGDGAWMFAIDRGGTFTDVVARRPDGFTVVRKLLSDDSGRYEDAAVAAIEGLLAEFGPDPIASVKMGTTVATNALLERRGEPVLLAITRGLGDALSIGYQSRPDIFARRIVLPEPLHDRVLEIDERVTADGGVLRPLDIDAARAGLQAAFASGLRAVAIVLMHGWRWTAHEVAVVDAARAIGFTQVSVSHEVGPLIKLIPLGNTSVVDAYLSPVLRAYVGRVVAALGNDTRLSFMQSNGGLTDAAASGGKDAILSGPAGGSSPWSARQRRPVSAKSSVSTWVAPRPTCRISRERSSTRTRRWSRASASARRCWRSTPLRRGADQFAGSTDRAFASDPRPPARSPAPPAPFAADR